MNVNSMLASEEVAVVSTVDPSNHAVGAAASADWVDMGNFKTLLAVIALGTFAASGKVDAKLQQATDSVGTSKKDIEGKAITQVLKATGENTQALINLKADELDVNGGFNHVNLVLTITTAACNVSAVVLGCAPRTLPASDDNLDSVTQIVG